MGMSIGRAQSIIQAAHRNIAYFQEINKQEKTEMSIDESINGIEKRILPIYDNDADHEALVTAIDTMRKYQMFQAKYVERLKANMVAMLEEIQLEIEESCICTYEVNKLIQEKIDKLRGEKKE